MTQRTFVIGVGMTKFEKPGSREWDYPEMARESGTAALEDARIGFDKVERAFASYVAGDSCAGNRAVYELGTTGIPIVNVNNNCASGSSALYLAREAVKYGQADCVLALGFEKMERGSIKNHFHDREAPMKRMIKAMWERRGRGDKGPIAAQMFGNAFKEYQEQYGATVETLAKISVKNYAHSVNNPRSQFQAAKTIEDVLAAPMTETPLTRLMCCPTSDGSAAAIVASERFVEENGLWDRAVEITGQSLTTDTPESFNGTERAMVGYYFGQKAADNAYAEAGLTAEDIQVIELHDCFSSAELMAYEALRLCEEGKATEIVENGDNTYGGQWVVNPSGGLSSKGHPLGATGLAQCAELTWQLRGEAGARQVEGATAALSHNLGLGGAGVVTIYQKVAR
jgi:acetyl-CoA acyltransferase